LAGIASRVLRRDASECPCNALLRGPIPADRSPRVFPRPLVQNHIAQRVRYCLAPAVYLLLGCAGWVNAQTPASGVESRLSGLNGLERARVLAKLVDTHKIDDPEHALRYGAEALKLFAVTPDPVANISTLNEMAWAHMTLGHYDSTTFYADSGQRFAERVGDKTGQARALNNLGALAQRVGDPKHAVDRFNEALVVQRRAGNDRDVANSLNNLGFVYSTDLADYGKALTYHLEALSIRERLGDKASIALSLNNIGIIYGRLRDFSQAQTYFDRALTLRRELGNKTRVAATLNNIGDTYLDAGDLARALSYQRQALEIRAKLDDRSAIALSHRNVGAVYLAMHRTDDARRELLKAVAISEPLGDKGLTVQIRLTLAACERERGAPPKAEAYARSALALAETMQSRDLVRRASEELAADQEADGRLADALREFKRSKVVSDSIFSAETARRIAVLMQMFSSERRGRELDSLRRHQAELQLEASERALQRDFAAGIAILIAVIAFFMYRYRVQRTRLAEALSVTDALTGLWNRRYVQQSIQMEVAASLRRHRVADRIGRTVDDADVIFVTIDIDHFKRVNDDFGHAVGDQLLIQLATVLKTTCRDSDMVVRWGGDEFLVVARFTNRYQGAATAERLRQAIERHVTTLPDGRTIRVTASIGFAAFPFDLETPDALSWDAVIALADQGGYLAKRDGRNAWAGLQRVERGGAPLTSPVSSAADIEALVRDGRVTIEASRRPGTGISIASVA
jgi:two-component system cell cycle response regulator